MNIPKTLKIGGFTYEVEKTDNIPLGSHYTGEIDYEKRKILIRPQSNKENEKQTFLHELIHAMANQSYIDLSESQVEVLSRVLHDVIVNNPKIFEVKK